MSASRNSHWPLTFAKDFCATRDASVASIIATMMEFEFKFSPAVVRIVGKISETGYGT
jgi:hypothetical protein